MKNLVKTILASLMIMSLTSAKAEIQVGVGLLTGQSNVSGTETENGERNSSFVFIECRC
jgi:hypothetical protein